MEQAWQEVKSAPEGQVVLSAQAINVAYADLVQALVAKRVAKEAYFHGDAGDNELYYAAELSDVDVEIARAEVDRLTKLMDLLELQVITEQMAGREE